MVDGAVLGKIRWALVCGSSVPFPLVLFYNNTNIPSLKAKNPLASVFESFHCFDALWQGSDEWKPG